MKAIINGIIVTKNGVLENKVLLFDKKIISMCDEIPENCELIDAKQKIVTPGLIDIHVHGSCNFDTMDNSIEAIEAISNGICKNGVTSFLPTTMTMSKEHIYNSLNTIKECMANGTAGAKVIGAHMEGPFINPIYKGAQDAKYILKPNFQFIKNYTDVIKLVSYSPELDDDYEFTKKVKENTKIILSICHSNASYKQTMEAVNLGASNITHLFNAMTPLNHREPGVVGAALMSNTYCEIIADKIHVDKNLFQFILNNKGKEKVILITDSMRAGCMKDGKYDLGGQDVYVKGGAARLINGTLAGSILTLNKAVYNFFENTNLELNEVINMASLNPAKSIGIDDKKGSLEIGKDADICIFDDEMNCHLSISEGRIIFNKLN
ncbi:MULTISPECIES: N-acetylglucosamine-6-phosphate deacetylase [unclassified Clostridium]|uniref:N-acetylglucosamine-6-phosphate deacetylase n=1 Tax=unclassified Clostridium TaxID=2614128 RepID=UPI0013F08B5A|nr:MULTISPECIES: N-acetylglucosamine-6-phosphate deacetylase [unclassified Clostridium]NFG61093.1 N-acetylglucosamine-6-phosphate deacetylase [Clostridium botulinum]NFQ08839.1 N-acetylglucosamine-6-phosphate deacetylase [Clostridium botulinum]